MSDKIDYYFPLNPTKVRKSDKPSTCTTYVWENIGNLQEMTHKDQVKSARAEYYHSSVKKLKTSNNARWWKEMKALGGLMSQQLWFHQLLSNDYPTCSVLAGSYNDFLVGLTAHFEPLVRCEVSNNLETPSQ